MNIQVKLIRYDREEKRQRNLLKELTWFFAFRRREISRELKQYSSISHHDILFIGVSQFLMKGQNVLPQTRLKNLLLQKSFISIRKIAEIIILATEMLTIQGCSHFQYKFLNGISDSST